MKSITANAEVFVTAFNSLPRKEKRKVISKILIDKKFKEDLIDIALIEQRKNEPSRSIDEYLKDNKTKKKNCVYN